MEQITAYILSLLEVIEKELTLLKLLTVRTFKGLSCIAVSLFLFGAGFLLLTWTCFQAISALLGVVAAGFIASLMLIGGGGLFLWISKRNLM